MDEIGAQVTTSMDERQWKCKGGQAIPFAWSSAAPRRVESGPSRSTFRGHGAIAFAPSGSWAPRNRSRSSRAPLTVNLVPSRASQTSPVRSSRGLTYSYSVAPVASIPDRAPKDLERVATVAARPRQ